LNKISSIFKNFDWLWYLAQINKEGKHQDMPIELLFHKRRKT